MLLELINKMSIYVCLFLKYIKYLVDIKQIWKSDFGRKITWLIIEQFKQASVLGLIISIGCFCHDRKKLHVGTVDFIQ